MGNSKARVMSINRSIFRRSSKMRRYLNTIFGYLRKTTHSWWRNQTHLSRVKRVIYWINSRNSSLSRYSRSNSTCFKYHLRWSIKWCWCIPLHQVSSKTCLLNWIVIKHSCWWIHIFWEFPKINNSNSQWDFTILCLTVSLQLPVPNNYSSYKYHNSNNKLFTNITKDSHLTLCKNHSKIMMSLPHLSSLQHFKSSNIINRLSNINLKFNKTNWFWLRNHMKLKI